MIPHYQRISFLVLLTLSVLMGAWLIRVHRKNVQRLETLASTSASPIEAPPSTTEAEAVTFLMANDADGSIQASDRQIALPTETGIRMRAILERLFVEYALPESKHPVNAGGAAIADIFLINLPLTPPGSDTVTAAKTIPLPGQPDLTKLNGHLAVINLRQTFVDAHPSGVQVETLTLLSILGTVHANFPQVTQVRFLVDGKTRPTLAGHVDLTRIYPSTDTTIQPADTTHE